MAPERFLQKLVDVIGYIKVPVVVLIFIIALVKVLAHTFVGGQDKRANFSTVVGLMIMASIIFYVDKFVVWLHLFIGR